VFAVVTIVLVTLACRNPPPANELRIAHESDVLALDPVKNDEAVSTSVLANIYEGLVAFDKDMRLVPALAVSWSAIDDQTWLVNLRRGVRFHDGRMVTASDVKFTFDRARTIPDSAFAGQLATVKDVEIVDVETLRIRTLRPDPLLLNRLAYIMIVPRGRSVDDYSSRPIGSGPYRFVRWEPGKALEVEAAANYWGGRPRIDRIQFRPIESGDEALRVLKRREVDVLRWVPETMMNDFGSIPGIRIEHHAGITTYFLWARSTQEKGASNPFVDKRVRQAISMAIDRRAIIAALGGIGTPANQLVVKGVFGHVASLPELPFDPEKARTLLRQAGYAQGFTTTLVHRPGTSVTPVCEMVRRMLGRVGIDVTLEVRDWPSIISAWTAGRLPFFFAAWTFDDGDALSFLKDCLFTRDAGRATGSSNPGFSNLPLDALIEENGRLLREGDRLRHYETVMSVALEAMPIVPIYNRDNVYAVSDKVRWQPRLDGNLVGAEMSLE
jgi:peptide/nickel transport system substrate-binding protein